MVNAANKSACIELGESSVLATRVLVWSMGGNLSLAVMKLFAGVLFDSSGLFADGLQSLSCAIGCVLIMYGVRVSRRGCDERFPYGYGKVEFLVAFAVFSVLFAVGLSLCLSSTVRILQRAFPVPNLVGLWVAALSVALNFLMYRYSLRAVHELKSPGMIANASQIKADMMSSLGVCAGILLSQFGDGFGVFDLIVAFLVGIMIIRDSYGHWRGNLDVLLDAAPESDHKEEAARVIAERLPKEMLRFVKIRRTGARYWLGIGVDFPDSGSFAEAESAMRELRALLCRRLDWVGTVECFCCISAESDV